MTASSIDQIQTLINEIDQVLQKSTPRLPWVLSGETAQQRKLLERIRNQLISLQKRLASEASGRWQSLPRGESPLRVETYPAPDTIAQPILQTVAQEILQLRTHVIQPLQTEITHLQQQRESLQQELRQLEMQRQSYLMAQHQASQHQMLNDQMQAWMVRLQDLFTQQLSQLPAATQPMLASRSDRLPVEQLQTLQTHSDQLFIQMDTSLQQLFEGIQRDLASYETSLAQSLGRMHTLGQQGEVMFSALINHLADRLSRESLPIAPSHPNALSVDPLAQLSPTPITSDLGTPRVTDAPATLEALPSPLPQSSLDFGELPPARRPILTAPEDDRYDNLFGAAGTEVSTATQPPLTQPTPPAIAQSDTAQAVNPADAVDEIVTLTDLFEDGFGSPVLARSADLTAPSPASSPASEDSLLPELAPALPEDPTHGFWLDASTLSTFQEDLSKLEPLPQSSATDFPPIDPRPPAASLSDPSLSLSDEPLNDSLTLDTIDNFFADLPPVMPARASETNRPEGNTGPVITLDEISHLFADAPPTPDVASTSPAEGSRSLTTSRSQPTSPIPSPVAWSSNPTSEGTEGEAAIDDISQLFDDFLNDTPRDLASSRATDPPQARESLPPTEFEIERIDDLFVEVPLLPTNASEPDRPAIADRENEPENPFSAFTLEQVGDLFMEIPRPSPGQDTN